ncbi:galactose-1-phosphate uridylyltransferase [Oceanobacillus picturae]|uniref:Galactose-1-phosphate uridylyltransferase n=1 Tax=Oceanobacillus picturae TaxID=171693 RepID=A0A0U9H9J6_9BACI|nr:UDP-glucose--hexose-1-phosphate uridylyltransferase [Oceanobacillus picturae]GAQ19367.1 galactose-1-phosphate uridylyltransferase [Oceanobacillus picturae]
MIYEEISALVQQAISEKLIEPADEIYARNQVMQLLELPSFPEIEPVNTDRSIPDILEAITSYAIEENIITDVLEEKEMLSANIMNCFIARPSVANEQFYKKYDLSPVEATDYFYQLSKNSNYIQMNRIKKNVHFKAETKYGNLDITINLSKPEKDPEQIRREREMKQALDYPKCVLCIENEGYAGRTGHPARANHRMIRVPLGGETWYFQYSPYVYYNEHSILLAEEHRDMKISKEAFARLLEFTDIFPHYFIGSNADLPIVGGSILSHDHYQAGRYDFAMSNAAEAFPVTLGDFPDVHAAILNWPLSVIRLKSEQKAQLLNAADHILQTWSGYSDERAAIQAFTGDVAHNTITPIAHMRDGKYELDLVLRNNRTSAEHPMGIFHPHADVHHIKKENIGLIEVMGLAVLPARLKEEIVELEKELMGQDAVVNPIHAQWAADLKEIYGTIETASEAKKIIQHELGKKFVRVLEDAGVFKEKDAFQRFLHTL